jgi:hypothetical protein
MYCSLEDAFPEERRRHHPVMTEDQKQQQKQDQKQQQKQQQQKSKAYKSSCWVQEKTEPPAPPPIVLGANVQHVAEREKIADTACFSALHHCLSCQTCQRMLYLHHLSSSTSSTSSSPFTGSQEIVLGAQVSKREKRRSSKRLAQRVQAMGAQVSTENQLATGGRRQMSIHILTEPISSGSNITWGHLLIILTAGAFLLLIVERLRTISQVLK